MYMQQIVFLDQFGAIWTRGSGIRSQNESQTRAWFYDFGKYRCAAGLTIIHLSICHAARHTLAFRYGTAVCTLEYSYPVDVYTYVYTRPSGATSTNKQYFRMSM